MNLFKLLVSNQTEIRCKQPCARPYLSLYPMYNGKMRLSIALVCIMPFFISSCVSVVLVGDPLSSEERVNLGYIYELRGRYDLAEKEYAKAIRRDKKNWLAYYNLGNIYARRGDWDKAQDLYEEALSIRWEPDVLNNLAYVLMKKGDYCSALWTIQEALKKHVKEEYTKTKEEIVKAIENSGVRCLSLEREGESR